VAVLAYVAWTGFIGSVILDILGSDVVYGWLTLVASAAVGLAIFIGASVFQDRADAGRTPSVVSAASKAMPMLAVLVLLVAGPIVISLVTLLLGRAP
jgi:hypothetical protein